MAILHYLSSNSSFGVGEPLSFSKRVAYLSLRKMADDQASLTEFADYADRHGLYDTFQNMVESALISRPDDVLHFFVEHLQMKKAQKYVVLGPPSYGIPKVAESISKALGTVLVNPGDLLKNAISRGNSFGIQAKPFVDSRTLVPDAVICGLVLARLSDPDVQNNGFTLVNFPRTRQQAKALARAGKLVDRVIHLDVPDDCIVERAMGMRLDPATGKQYHIVLDPPPPSALIESRLTQRDADSREEDIKGRINIHRANIDAVLSCYPTDKICKMRYPGPEGFFLKEASVVSRVLRTLGEGKRTNAPHEYKIVVAGLPGSGKTTVCEMLSKTKDIVYVSPVSVMLEQVSAGTPRGKELEPFVNRPENAPGDVILDLICEKLLSKTCLDKGWVLDGFPKTKQDADKMEERGCQPSRLLWLDVDKATCMERLVHRRFDLIDGKVHNVFVEKDDPSPTWVQSQQDVDYAVQKRMTDSFHYKRELEDAYGFRTSVKDYKGIMQEIPAFGIGEKEENGKKKLFEYVNGSLLKPVPIVPKGA
ncbi:MAG: hypothetical protein SGCHY_003760 [Lobulomycetales sp.]